MTERSGRSLHDTQRLALREVDPELFALICAEDARQATTLSMVASENVVPRAVLEAQGSILTNKYADGYPARREYDGCEVVDAVEELAISRVTSLFGAEYANVQPYSGTNANAAVLKALCKPGEVVLGFDFEHGGHPSHYDPSTFAGHYYRGLAYHVRRSDRLVDMDEVAELADRHRPRVIIAGWSCYQRFLDFAAFREIADEVGAYLVVDMAHFSGLVAAKQHPDPVPYADVCTMTVHKTLGGARGGVILARQEFGPALDDAVFPGTQGCPLMHVVAAKAVTFALCATEEYGALMRQTVAGAKIVAKALHEREEQTNMSVVTGGTEVHQLLVDTSGSGHHAGEVLSWLHGVGICANAMRIAFDAASAPQCSGLRLGTASLATRGFDDGAFDELADVVSAVLSEQRRSRIGELAARIAALCESHPPVGLSDLGQLG